MFIFFLFLAFLFLVLLFFSSYLCFTIFLFSVPFCNIILVLSLFLLFFLVFVLLILLWFLFFCFFSFFLFCFAFVCLFLYSLSCYASFSTVLRFTIFLFFPSFSILLVPMLNVLFSFSFLFTVILQLYLCFIMVLVMPFYHSHPLNMGGCVYVYCLYLLILNMHYVNFFVVFPCVPGLFFITVMLYYVLVHAFMMVTFLWEAVGMYCRFPLFHDRVTFLQNQQHIKKKNCMPNTICWGLLGWRERTPVDMCHTRLIGWMILYASHSNWR